jgi:DNA invertase Pin-like site-specific DNA recombinase
LLPTPSTRFGRETSVLPVRASSTKQLSALMTLMRAIISNNQRRELEAVAERSGWQVVKIYEDSGISGAKGRDQRPGLDAMMRAVNAREFDMVASWSVDRLGRSLTDLLSILQSLHEKGAGLFLHQQGLDTSTTAGKAMFQMLGVFAEFERGIIRERVNAGLTSARAKGTKLGRRRPSIEARMKPRRASLGEACDGTAGNAACGFVQGEPSLTEPSGGFFATCKKLGAVSVRSACRGCARRSVANRDRHSRHGSSPAVPEPFAGALRQEPNQSCQTRTGSPQKSKDVASLRLLRRFQFAKRCCVPPLK